MLERIRLTNFRCFEDYEIEFNNFNVIVGKNNMGKSTIIDSLKLVSNLCRYAAYRGDHLEDRDIPFSLDNLGHDYNEEESLIYAKFADNTEIQIRFPLGDRPRVEIMNRGRGVSRQFLTARFKNSLGVIPPVGTFEDLESLGNEKYVKSILVSHLTPRHFRNIWYYFNEGFEDFRKIIEETWPGYTIEPPEFLATQNVMQMFFRERGITREIFWAGHGFQVWLQLMTFLVKLGRVDTLVLDEPDIYLHSDMQKKLVNLCKQRSSQVIIATHAVDIIEEVDPDDVVSIDKDSHDAKRLSDIDEVQTCINQLGSYQNLKLVNLHRGRTCLFVEGKDLRYLKKFARKLHLQTFTSEDGFSVIPLEGFSNWDRLMYVNWISKNAFGEKVKCYVILDRDYHSPREICDIKDNLRQKGVTVHVWDRKEIENYAINFEALYRMFTDKIRERHRHVSIKLSYPEFEKESLVIFEELKQHVISQMIASETEYRRNRQIDAATIVSQVIEQFEEGWKDVEFRKKVIPGKEYFAKLNTFLNDKYQVAISVTSAIDALRDEEINSEVIDFLNEFITFVKS
jgi:energy-coupling factor transporter ATP-binding protein EcfA2